MNAKKYILSLVLLACLSAPSYAINFGDNITVHDGLVGWNATGWWGAQEDNEVEPGILWKGQSYDLEGIIFDGANLTIVSGYNFWNPRTGMAPGDLFIDVDGDAVFGNPPSGHHGLTAEPNVWGYDYVYDIDFLNNTYDIYAIDASTLVRNVQNNITRGSNPWCYDSSLYPAAVPIFSGTMTYWDNLTDADLTDYGFVGAPDFNNPTYIDRHYAVQFDLTKLLLPNGTDFTAKWTMECGNDSVVGRGTVVPDGGATLSLLGSALLASALLKRKFRG